MVTRDCLPALGGEEEAAREGLCVCGSLDLLGNEKWFENSMCTAWDIDNRGKSLLDTTASSFQRLSTRPVATGGCLVNHKTWLKEKVIFKKNTNILI